MELYTLNDVLQDLRDLRDGMSTQKALADRIGISEQYLCDLLVGRRIPGEKVLKFLGYDKIIWYKRIKRTP